jgi:hypothetical protein
MRRQWRRIVSGVAIGTRMTSVGVVQTGNVSGGVVQFNNTGSITYFVKVSGIDRWLNLDKQFVGAKWWIRVTKTSGTPNFSPSLTGVWYSIDSGNYGAFGAVGACSGTIEIARDSTGANAVTVGTLTVDNSI